MYSVMLCLKSSRKASRSVCCLLYASSLSDMDCGVVICPLISYFSDGRVVCRLISHCQCHTLQGFGNNHSLFIGNNIASHISRVEKHIRFVLIPTNTIHLCQPLNLESYTEGVKKKTNVVFPRIIHYGFSGHRNSLFQTIA